MAPGLAIVAATTTITRQRADHVQVHFGIGTDGRLLAASAVGKGNAVAKDIRLAEMLIARFAIPTQRSSPIRKLTSKHSLSNSLIRIGHTRSAASICGTLLCAARSHCEFGLESYGRAVSGVILTGQMGRWVARAAATLINVLDPEVLLLGGYLECSNNGSSQVIEPGFEAAVFAPRNRLAVTGDPRCSA